MVMVDRRTGYLKQELDSFRGRIRCRGSRTILAAGDQGSDTRQSRTMAKTGNLGARLR